MHLLELTKIQEAELNDKAIAEAIDGSILNVDNLVEPGDDVGLIYEFYRNVNLTKEIKIY